MNNNKRRSKEKKRLVNFPQNTGYNIKARVPMVGVGTFSLTYFFLLFTYKALHRILKNREIKKKQKNSKRRIDLEAVKANG